MGGSTFLASERSYQSKGVPIYIGASLYWTWILFDHSQCTRELQLTIIFVVGDRADAFFDLITRPLIDAILIILYHPMDSSTMVSNWLPVLILLGPLAYGFSFE